MKTVVVLSAYNCAKTLKNTIGNIFNMVNDSVLVDGCSNDETYNVVQDLGFKHIIRYDVNLGYGANLVVLYYHVCLYCCT